MATGNKKHRQVQRPQGHEDKHALRLFVAVDIPPAAVDTLISWQELYLPADPALRMTPPGQLHVTLAFIGSVGDRERDLAFRQMEELERTAGFTATIDALVGLPRGRNPRVIAARVDEPAGKLSALHEELTAGLAAKGIYQRGKRPFCPHVTIARSRRGSRIDLATIAPEPFQFTAVRTTLYNSILKPSGALHKALKSVQLD